MLEIGDFRIVDGNASRTARLPAPIEATRSANAGGETLSPGLGRTIADGPGVAVDRGAEAGTAWRVRMFGYDFAAGPATGILAALTLQPSAGPRLVVTANIDHVVLLSENEAFREAYASAAVRTLDGTPLVWLARLRGQPAARVTGHDLLAHALFGRPSEGQRVFVVCPTDEVAVAIRDRLVQAGFAPDAVATCVPPFGFGEDAVYGRMLSGRIRDHGTTLLLMGVGAPRSEIWVNRQGAALGSPLVLAVGDAVGVAAGLVPRAPRILQRAGLEWAFRFAFAPRRLFHRYFVRSWRFLALLGREMRGWDVAR